MKVFLKNNWFKILDYFKKINTKKIWFLVGGLIFVCIFFIVYLSYKGNIYQKCPDEYGDDDASINKKLVDFDNWTKEFFDNHLDASLSDLSMARYDFYVKNNCTAAIRRYEDAKKGKADPSKMKIIDDVIEGSVKIEPI